MAAAAMRKYFTNSGAQTSLLKFVWKRMSFQTQQ